MTLVVSIGLKTSPRTMALPSELMIEAPNATNNSTRHNRIPWSLAVQLMPASRNNRNVMNALLPPTTEAASIVHCDCSPSHPQMIDAARASAKVSGTMARAPVSHVARIRTPWGKNNRLATSANIKNRDCSGKITSVTKIHAPTKQRIVNTSILID